MYKPVPQVQSCNEGEDSESELFNSSTLNFEEKSPQYGNSRGVAPQQQLEQPSMSTGRKIALTFSIVNCVVFIVLFLWILPCNFDTCKAPPHVKTKDWEVNLVGKGVQAMAMASSPTSRLKEMVILLSSETSHLVSTPYCFSNESNSLLGIRAADGKLVWEKNFTDAIQFINCSLIDVNNDGVDDCLLFPVAKSLSSLNSLTGAIMWEFHVPPYDLKTKEDSDLQILDIDALADLDNDTIPDLAIITSDSKVKFFIGISGRNGELLWRFPLNTSCIPIGQSMSITYVMSNPCLKEPPDFDRKNITSRFLTYGRSPSPPNLPPCLKCDALTNGIPKTRCAPDCQSARCGMDAGCKKEKDGSFICICTHDLSPEIPGKACPRNVVFSVGSQFPGKSKTLITVHRAGLDQEHGSSNMSVKARPSSPGLADGNQDYSEYATANAFALAYTLPIIVAIVLIGLVLLSIRLIRWIRIYRMTNRNRPNLRVGGNAIQKELLDVQSLGIDNAEQVSLFLLREWIELEQEIGEGCFGKVFRGRLRRPESSLPPSDPSYIKVDNSQAVAIKVLKTPSPGIASITAERELLREARTMASFSHENILTLHGIVINECNMGSWLVFEYMELGDLAQLLRSSNGYSRSKEKESHSSTRYLVQEDLPPIAEQIANGMKYLSSRNFVHRDLACRNCLVGERPSLQPTEDLSNLIIKISDFGMSRDLHSNEYYKMGGSRFLPVRWMPPEAILYGKFNEQSDVWSFGVLLWEIFSMGAIPYYGHANEEVVTMILGSIYLEPPNSAPPLIRQLMIEHCWKKVPSDRLSFTEIHAKLTGFSSASPPEESQVTFHRYVYLQPLPDLEQ